MFINTDLRTAKFAAAKLLFYKGQNLHVLWRSVTTQHLRTLN